MSMPLRSPGSAGQTPSPRVDNIVRGTSLDRLYQAVRNTARGGPLLDEPTFGSSPAEFLGSLRAGIPNPYGVGLAAYEPNNILFSDYAQAYGDVQMSKAEEEAKAQQELLTVDFSVPGGASSGGGGVTGVPFADLFTAAGARHSVPAALLAAVARAESNFSPTARSPAGAIGLMQFIPSTAAGLGVNPLDPASAIDGAARYLASNYARFGSWDLALAAYNAGPGAVSRYGGIPPYTETQNYVQRVNGYYSEYASKPLATGSGGGGALSGPVTQADGQVRTAVSAALNLAARRTPYVWGGTSASGVDCSGLIYYAFRAAGIMVPRLRAIDWGQMGHAVSLAQARPGDVVYYDNPNTSVDHVGLYIGNGQVVQAPYSGQTVKVLPIGNATSIRRVVEDSAFATVGTPTGTATSYAGQPYRPALSPLSYPTVAATRLAPVISRSGPMRPSVY